MPLCLGHVHDTAHGYAVEIDRLASVSMSFAMRLFAPAVMSLLAGSFQADAAELIGSWQVSAPTGSATFEFLDAPNSKIAGTYHYSPSDCQGDLVKLSAQPPIYMFRERPSNSRACGTGSIVRVAVTSTNAIRVDRIHPTSGEVQSTWAITHQPTGSAATSVVSADGVAAAIGSDDFVGRWKGTVQQSGVGPYAIDLSLRSLQVGAVVGDVKYPDYRCVGTWTLESQQVGEAIFVEKITSGPCLSRIRVQMKLAQGAKAQLSWIGRSVRANVSKDGTPLAPATSGAADTPAGASAPMTTSQYSSAPAVFGPSAGSTPQVYGCGRYQSGLGSELCVKYGITGGELDILVRELGPQGRLSEKTIRRYRAGAIASQFAPLADSVYQWRRRSVDTNGDGVPDWELDKDFSRHEFSTGFGAATYVRRIGGSDVSDVAIVFEGTSLWTNKDMLNNVQALLNVDPQYSSAMKYVSDVRERHKSVPVGRTTIVGHSLGGRLAQIFALRTHMNGITFNSAAPSRLATPQSGGAALIKNIFMEKDVVDELSEGFVLADDVGEPFRFAFEFNSALGAHSMERMVQHMNFVARVYLELMQPRIVEMCAGQRQRSISPDLCSPPAILSPIGAGVGSLAGPPTGAVSPTPSGPATASGDFVGQWKGTVQQSGVRPYAIELSLKSMQVGAVVGDVKYPDYRCVGTWTLESQQVSEAIFVEKIASGPCISGIRVQMKLVQSAKAGLFWLGRSVRASVVKVGGSRASPTSIPAARSTVASPAIPQISAADVHSIALKSDGTVWAWGLNNMGQLGNGSTTRSLVPVQVSGLTGVVAVASAIYHSVALKSDGTVWAWGQNRHGKLGNSKAADSLVPVEVAGLTGVVAIAAGFDHSVALKSDGTVWVWGDNRHGLLGNDSVSESYLPMQVSGITDVMAIASHDNNVISLRRDRTVWVWGDNNQGQLGHLGGDSFVPVQVSGLNDVVAVDTAGYHSVAVRSDGTVWAWGSNETGALGNGGTVRSLAPVKVSGLTRASPSVGAVGLNSVAVKSDGTVWAWGWNHYGQLGNNSTLDSYVPTQVSGLTDVLAVAAGGGYTLALKSDGTVWAWGLNTTGQLGNASTANRPIPVQVVGPAGQGFLNLGGAGARMQPVLGASPTVPIAPSPATVIDDLKLSQKEKAVVRYVAQSVLPYLAGPASKQIDDAAAATWWSLNEGIAGLSSPSLFSNCYPGEKRLGPLEECVRAPDGKLICRVGLAGIQAGDHSESEVALKVKELYPSRTEATLLSKQHDSRASVLAIRSKTASSTARGR